MAKNITPKNTTPKNTTPVPLSSRIQEQRAKLTRDAVGSGALGPPRIKTGGLAVTGRAKGSKTKAAGGGGG